MTNALDILSIDFQYFSNRNGTKINAVIAHAIGLYTLEEIFSCFNEFKISSHYIVPQISGEELQKMMPERFGKYILKFPKNVPIIQLVQDEDMAYHAGVSSFGGLGSGGFNGYSIGVEFHAPGYGVEDHGNFYNFAPFTKAQQESGIKLISYLMQKHKIPTHHLLAHSTIAPLRKTDPGPLFFWKTLAQNKLGYLPIPDSKNIPRNIDAPVQYVQEKLKEIGFTLCPQSGILDDKTQHHINAYIMQFAQDLWRGKSNEITIELLASISSFNVDVF